MKISEQNGAVSFAARLQPRASRDEIVGVYQDALKIRLTAPPVDDRANEALRKLSDVVTERQLLHDDNPILSMMAANAIVRHGRNKTIRLDKDTAAEKIDGIAALAMAIGRAIAVPPELPADDPDLVIA